MVLIKRVNWLFVVILAIHGSNVALAQDNTHEAKPAVPELPPEVERSKQSESQNEEASKIVTNEDANKHSSSFFTDNVYTVGPARNFNVLDLGGYLRLRFNYFRNAHLGTFIPDQKHGNSLMPPNLSFIGENLNHSSDETISSERNPAQNNFSGNMRLRVDPTINVSEMVRVKATVDILDNMVLGSTPTYLSQGAPSPSSPASFMSRSQNPSLRGINSWQGAISLKRAWGEASFPIGELRFGRMPFHWGLGILYNSGDDITNDYGDQVDGLFFATKFFDHFFTPGYSIAYTGPVGRGGGQFSTADNFQSAYLPTEAGQRYPLESGDLTHVISLSFLKRESDFITNKKLEEGRAVFDYGIFGSYRRQFLDSQAYAINGIKFEELAKNIVKRDSHVGLLSLWTAFTVSTFHMEMEAAGIWGKYQIGEKDSDLMAKNDDGTSVPKRNVWLLQGGIALESRYGFLNDRLQVGLDGGIASSQGGPGFGIREGVKKNPKAGDADGQKLPSESGYKTNFKFNPAYTVDLLLFREILGGISGTAYVKPHLAYFFSRNFGLRGDVITSIAPDKTNTTGNSNWLGVEADASAFLRTEGGFYFQLAYGVLFPLKGLDHQRANLSAANYENFGKAKVAQTLQAFFGIVF